MILPSKVELQCKNFGVSKVKFKYTVVFKGLSKFINAKKTAELQYELVKKEIDRIPATSIRPMKEGYQVSGIIEKRIFGNIMMFYFMQWGDGCKTTIYDLLAKSIDR